MADCDQEMCPMWDGHGCPCHAFGLDPDDLPTDGVFTIETNADLRAQLEQVQALADEMRSEAAKTAPMHGRAVGLWDAAAAIDKIVGMGSGATPPGRAPIDIEGMAAEIGRHGPTDADSVPGGMDCRCGLGTAAWEHIEDADRHVAESVTAWLTAQEAK